jgi:hypothetical protein
MPLTREDRVRYGRLGAYARLAQTADRSEMTAPARAAGPASLDWHAKKIDPDGKLPPEQRYKMAEAARKAWYLALSEKSRRARAARRDTEARAS